MPIGSGAHRRQPFHRRLLCLCGEMAVHILFEIYFKLGLHFKDIAARGVVELFFFCCKTSFTCSIRRQPLRSAAPARTHRLHCVHHCKAGCYVSTTHTSNGPIIPPITCCMKEIRSIRSQRRMMCVCVRVRVCVLCALLSSAVCVCVCSVCLCVSNNGICFQMTMNSNLHTSGQLHRVFPK